MKIPGVVIFFRDIVLIITFLLAVNLENPSGTRLFQIYAFFLIFFAWIHIRDFFSKSISKSYLYGVLSFLPDGILLYLLEESSKYVVNYYFNVYYFYVLISLGFILKRIPRIVSGLLILLAASIKYIRLFETALENDNPAYGMPFVISYSFFTFMVFVTIMLLFEYAGFLREQREMVEKLNIELSEKNRTIKELATLEERNRIARDIHDTVGHNLIGLIMNLEFLDKCFQKGQFNDRAGQKLEVCHEIALGCLEELRNSVNQLKASNMEKDLLLLLEELTRSCIQNTGIKVKIIHKGFPYNFSDEKNIEISRMAQEAITNAVKHSGGSEVTIMLDFIEKSLVIEMFDDGKAGGNCIEGNGLKGMKERVLKLGGEISFVKEPSFKIKILIPTGEDNE